MRSHFSVVGLLFLLSLGSAGCLYRGAARSFDAAHAEDKQLTLIRSVPVVRQEGFRECGAAALSSLLAHWGQVVEPAVIQVAVHAPENTALSAGALRDYLKAHGFDAYLFEGTFADLEAEIAAGRPVLVGTIKQYIANQQVSHYEVVTGLSPELVVTMDPRSGYRRYPRGGFAEEWGHARYLMLVAAPNAEVASVERSKSAL